MIFKISLVGGLSIGFFLKLIKQLNVTAAIKNIIKIFLNLKFKVFIFNTIQIIIRGKINITYLGDITDALIIEYVIVKKYEDKIIDNSKLSLEFWWKIFLKFLINKKLNKIKKIAPMGIEPKNDRKW